MKEPERFRDLRYKIFAVAVINHGNFFKYEGLPTYHVLLRYKHSTKATSSVCELPIKGRKKLYPVDSPRSRSLYCRRCIYRLYTRYLRMRRNSEEPLPSLDQGLIESMSYIPPFASM